MAIDNPTHDACAPTEPAAQPVQQLELCFADSTGTEITFRLKPTTKLKKAMDAFSARCELPRHMLRFLVDGERVQDDSTPESLELQDGDRIDVHTEQIGGGIKGNVSLGSAD